MPRARSGSALNSGTPSTPAVSIQQHLHGTEWPGRAEATMTEELGFPRAANPTSGSHLARGKAGSCLCSCPRAHRSCLACALARRPHQGAPSLRAALPDWLSQEPARSGVAGAARRPDPAAGL